MFVFNGIFTNMKNIILLITFSFCLNFAFAANLVKIIRNGDSEKFQSFLDKGGDLNESVISYGDTMHALMCAVGYEHVEIVEIIIANKEKIANWDHVLSEAFIFSLSREDGNLTRLLYAENPNFKDRCGLCHEHNALMVAIVEGSAYWYFELKPKSELDLISSSGNNLLHLLGDCSSKEIIDDVMGIEGLDINLVNNRGFTPLDRSVGNAKHSILYDMMIDKGASLEKATKLLYVASLYKNSDLITSEFVASRSQELWVADADEDIPLNFALYHNDGVYDEEQLWMLFPLLKGMIDDVKKNGASKYKRVYFEGKGSIYNLMYMNWEFEESEFEESGLEYFLEFAGIIENETGEPFPITKKEYKHLVKNAGETMVNKWYEKFGLSVPK